MTPLPRRCMGSQIDGPDGHSARRCAAGACTSRMMAGAGAKAVGLGVLSMGMSADFETAIAMGATHVRVGSALFGHRVGARAAAAPEDRGAIKSRCWRVTLKVHWPVQRAPSAHYLVTGWLVLRLA